MRTKVTNVSRSYPTITERRMQAIDGKGTVIISEHTPNEPFESPDDAGWIELRTEEEMIQHAQRGCTVWRKTATLGGRSRFYVDMDDLNADSMDMLHVRKPELY